MGVGGGGSDEKSKCGKKKKTLCYAVPWHNTRAQVVRCVDPSRRLRLDGFHSAGRDYRERVNKYDKHETHGPSRRRRFVSSLYVAATRSVSAAVRVRHLRSGARAEGSPSYVVCAQQVSGRLILPRRLRPVRLEGTRKK